MMKRNTYSELKKLERKIEIVEAIKSFERRIEVQKDNIKMFKNFDMFNLTDIADRAENRLDTLDRCVDRLWKMYNKIN